MKATKRRTPQEARRRLAALDFILPVEIVEAWLRKFGIDAWAFVRGAPVWKNPDGTRRPITPQQLELMIGEADPVLWARVHLRETDPLRDDDGNIIIPVGSPWELTPVQAKIARLAEKHKSLILEAASETGKSRFLVLRALRSVDVYAKSILVGTFSENALDTLSRMIVAQCERNVMIGDGIAEKKLSPGFRMEFHNGGKIIGRICGVDGHNFLSEHVDEVLLDEAAKFRGDAFAMAWRAVRRGGSRIVGSTPDGSRTSPFFSLCQRSKALEKRDWEPDDATIEKDSGFVKVNVSRLDMPKTFVSDRRIEELKAQYGGEEAPEYQQQILGRWGAPSSSVWPPSLLEPNLTRNLPDYRIVVAANDRDRQVARVRVAKLSEDPGVQETMVADREVALRGGHEPTARDLASSIAAHFPSLGDSPLLYGGMDLGEVDDTEILLVRDTGARWEDVFRVVLRRLEYQPAQTEVIRAIDHAAGHRVILWAVDAGAGGGLFVEGLKGLGPCPYCARSEVFVGRADALAFATMNDEIDLETGKTIPNPDRRDAAGNPVPFRISNKEAATRYITRRFQARAWAVADDGGAGHAPLGAASLLLGHVADGVTSRGERKYRSAGNADHAVDARRMVALAIATTFRDYGGTPFVSPSLDVVSRITRDGRVVGGSELEVDPYRAVGSEPFGFGLGGVKRSFGDW
jgi:hypothetical protein